jgi:hypothetical protein
MLTAVLMSALPVACIQQQQQQQSSDTQTEKLQEHEMAPPLHLGAVHQVYPEQGFALLRIIGPVPKGGTVLISHPMDGSNSRIGNLIVSSEFATRNNIIAADIRSGTVMKGDRVFQYRNLSTSQNDEESEGADSESVERPILDTVPDSVIKEAEEEQAPMPGYTYFDTQNGFNIYTNDNFLPMGFAYDAYIPRETFDEATKTNRVRMLLKGIVLDEETAEAHSDILPELATEKLDYTYDGYAEDVQNRLMQSAYYFEKDTRGFTSKIDLAEENLVFFSVPYESGWSATVNGEPAEIIKANLGFMAVRCPAGECEIRFNYMTPGLIPGLIVTAAGLVLLLAYLISHRVRRMVEERPAPEVGQVVPDLFSGADDWAESGEEVSLQSLLFELTDRGTVAVFAA